MTKTNTENSESLTNMNRRRFLTGTAAAGTVAAVGTVPRFSPIGQARAIAPAVLVGGYAIGVATAYAARRVDTFLTGDDFDDEEFDQLAADEAHALIREIGMDMAAADDSALTNLENVLDLAKNAAYNDAQAAAVEQMELGNTEADVDAAAVEAVGSFYTTQQQNVLDHISIQHGKLARLQARVMDQSELDDYNTILTLDGSGSRAGYDGENYRLSDGTRNADVGLVDGSTYTYTGLDVDRPSGTEPTERPIEHRVYGRDDGNTSVHTIEIIPVGTGSQVEIYNLAHVAAVWDEIIAQHDAVVADISAWVTSVYPNYESGDIDLADLTTSAEFSQTAAEETGFSHSAADLGLLGVPISEGTMVIELPTANDGEGATVEGVLATRNPPEGGFEVGVEYDPQNIAGPVWMAYNYEQDGEMASDLVDLQQPFVITEAEDIEGNSLDVVTFRSRNQRTLETDIAALNEELSQLREYQEEMQEQQKEAAGGGGGAGMFDNPASLLGLGAIGAFLAAIFLGNN